MGKDEEKNCCRAHWCLWVYIALAIVGIAVPAYMYLKPCEDQLTVHTMPMDVFLLIDASKSLKPKSWQGEKDAAQQILTELAADVVDLKVGFLTFTGHWKHKKDPILRNVTNLSYDIEHVTSGIGKLPGPHYLEYGTNFHEPLMECERQFNTHGSNGSYKLCVLLTDGEDMSFTGSSVDINKCTRGCSHPVKTAGFVKKHNNTDILAIYSGHSAEGREILYDMSSCTESGEPVDDCLYFTQVDDFADLRSKTANITSTIVDRITTDHVECVKAEWLYFLLLLLPLLFMLVLPSCLRCCGSLKTVTRREKVVNQQKLVPPPPPISAAAPAPVTPVEKQLKSKKAYKWEVDTGKYIRTGGNIRPHWGKVVPPSAPTEGARRKRTAEEWEDPDGFDCEYVEVEVEQTLEEWAEEKMTKAAKWACCCCCCCCCREDDDEVEAILLLET